MSKVVKPSEKLVAAGEDGPGGNVDGDEDARAEAIAEPSGGDLSQSVGPEKGTFHPVNLPAFQRDAFLKRVRGYDLSQTNAVQIHQEGHHRRGGKDLMADDRGAGGGRHRRDKTQKISQP